MDSNLPFSSVLIIVLLATSALCACSTYVQPLEPASANNKGFRFKLKYAHYSGIKRGRHRLNGTATARKNSSKISSPIKAGDDIGELFMELSIGTPPKTHLVIMDTGSDFIWIECDPRVNSPNKKAKIFYPEDSSSYSELPCSTGLCKALPQTTCGSERCEYYYKYRGSSTRGILARETLTFGDVTVPNIAFGCGVDNEGDSIETGSGIVGLGLGPLSLVLQLKETKFGYCLPSMSDTKSRGALLIGDQLESLNIEKLSGVKTTPLITNQFEPSHYYLSLHGISIGGTKLPIKKSVFELNRDDGTGGLVIDSGTAVTRLEESAYDLVKEELIKQIKLPVDESESSELDLDLCFKLPEGGSDEVKVPEFRFHFHGADLDLQRESYMIDDKDQGLMCLAMLFSPLLVSIFGAAQQQNLLVIHNLEKETLSFVPTQCHQL